MSKLQTFRVLRTSLIFAVCALVLTGCARSAANMAATQPERKDLGVLVRDTPRDHVVAKLGPPAITETLGNKKVEVYNFVQGYSASSRTARVFTHSTLSIATLGLWEVTGTAIEGYARGNDVSIRIVYSKDDRLETFEVLQGLDKVADDIPTRKAAQ